MTGDILATMPLSYPVYGLASDEQGVYACHAWDWRVTAYTGDLAARWDIGHQCYGIATDGQGGVWAGGYPAALYSNVDGSILLQSEYSCNGIIVSPKDGTVHLGQDDMGNGVIVLDPANPDMSYWPPRPAVLKVYDFNTWNASGTPVITGPRGSTVSADGIIYTLNRTTSNLTRIDMTDDSYLVFGDSVLEDGSAPYGYSSDWTGVFKCNSGPVMTWESDAKDVNGIVNWDWISWVSNTPAGTNIELYYQLDSGPGWTLFANTSTQASGTAAINPPQVGQTIRVKAVLTSWDYPAAQPTLTSLIGHYFVTVTP
jgi:hypothetical protein